MNEEYDNLETQRGEHPDYYYPFPPESLYNRAKAYYQVHIGEIQEELRKQSADKDTIQAISEDYAQVLVGTFTVSGATLEQMKQSLEILSPAKAFNIDRYGLYLFVLSYYYEFINYLIEFTDKVSGEGATVDSKYRFLKETADNSRKNSLFQWLIRYGYITIETFSELSPEKTYNFLFRTRYIYNLSRYLNYYFIAKYVLLATPDELEGIEKPTFDGEKALSEVAEETAKNIKKSIDETAEKWRDELLKLGVKETVLQNIDNDIELYSVYTKINTKGITFDNQIKKITQTLEKELSDFFERKDFAKYKNLTTPAVVEKVMNGLAQLRAFSVKDTFDTTLIDIANLCGYTNTKEKLGIYGALWFLNNRYIYVNLPYKRRLISNEKGKQVLRYSGGLTAIKVISIDRLDETGFFTIHIPNEVFKEHKIYVNAGIYLALTDKTKGRYQNRFNSQLLNTTHKKEDDLINEIFDCENKSKKTIQNHRAEWKKQLRDWFDLYQQEGILSYGYQANSKRELIYNWAFSKQPHLPKK